MWPPLGARVTEDVQVAAKRLGLQVRMLTARNEQELTGVFRDVKPAEHRALLVTADPIFLSRRALLISLIAQSRIPSIYDFRDYAEAGGLMSYGASLSDSYRMLGSYAGRILKGEKPGDLPILQPTKFEFIINLKTAKALDLAVPDRALALADEVIE